MQGQGAAIFGAKNGKRVETKKASKVETKKSEFLEEVPGISATSPDGEWTGELHILRYDFAENYETEERAFFINDKAVFVADEMLALGTKKVSERLCQEALRIWYWHRQDGTRLEGRVPTGFECKMYEAASVLCGLYAEKPQPIIS